MTTCELISFFRQTKPVVRNGLDEERLHQWEFMVCKMAEALDENKELFLENCDL